MKTEHDMTGTNLKERLRYHITGAIERGGATPIIEQSKGEGAHTPGPWRVQVAAGHISVVCDSQQVVKMIEFPQISIVKANARLIAAAPELLAACKDASDFLSPRRAKADLAIGSDSHHVFKHLRAAIRKATNGNL